MPVGKSESASLSLLLFGGCSPVEAAGKIDLSREIWLTVSQETSVQKFAIVRDTV